MNDEFSSVDPSEGSVQVSDLTLFGCPKACSLVSHIALEMTACAIYL